MNQQVSQAAQPFAPPTAPVFHQSSGSELKSSGLGITSFVLAILAGVFAIVLIGVAGYIEASRPGGMNEESPVAMIVGLSMFAIVGMCFLGLCLGIAALFQSNRSKVFAIIGVIFNLMVVLGIVGLALLGMSMQV